MKNMSSRLEERLTRLLTSTPPRSVPTTLPRPRVDLVYLAGDDQEHLESLLR